LWLVLLVTLFSAPTLSAQAIADAMRKEFASGGSAANRAPFQDFFLQMNPNFYSRNGMASLPIDAPWSADAFNLVQTLPGRGTLSNSALAQTLQYTWLNQLIPVVDAQSVGSTMGRLGGGFNTNTQYVVSRNNPRATKARHFLYLVLISSGNRIVQGTTGFGNAVVYAQNGPYTVWASPSMQGNGFDVWSMVEGGAPRGHGRFSGVNVLFIGESDRVAHTGETRSAANIIPANTTPVEQGYLGAGAYIWTASGPGVPGVIQSPNVVFSPVGSDFGGFQPPINLPSGF
jgi:hypothetical protein